MSRSFNLYAGATLDRAGPLRKDAAWIAGRLAASESRLVPVWRSQTLIDGRDPAAPALPSLPVSGAPEGPAGAELALLGLDDAGVAWFAADVSALEEAEARARFAPFGQFVELRTVGAVLSPADSNRAAYARGLLWWHQRHRFCGVCGAATASAEAGHVRVCGNPACAVQHFPRTDPAVIVLVHDGGDRCLLGRQPRFSPGFYSTLAGFVEPGESLEEAVAREVFEETGVHIADIRYQSSQPWPFPSSLMLGFHARATSFAVTVQAEEMEDARWFDRATVADAANHPWLKLPRPDSVSRRLIEDWVRGA